jgi:hypothetical protein
MVAAAAAAVNGLYKSSIVGVKKATHTCYCADERYQTVYCESVAFELVSWVIQQSGSWLSDI